MARNARIVVGLDGRITLVNEPAQRLLGFAEDELIGVMSESLLPPRCRDEHVRARDEFLAEPNYDAEPLAPGRTPLRTGRGQDVHLVMTPEPLLRGDRLWLSLTLQMA